MANSFKCRRCGVGMGGRAVLCIACFLALHRPCPECMRRTSGDTWRTCDRYTGPRARRCRLCRDERYVLIERDGTLWEN